MKRDFVAPAPLVVNWALTNRCNFECRHCYSRPEARDELDPETTLELLGKVARAKVLSVNFGGGEPLLRTDLLEVAAAATALGMAVSLNSNGSLLDGRAAAGLKSAGVKKVGISIDSPKADVHDRFRGVETSHAKALAALAHLRQAGVETSVSCVICQINSSDFEELVDMAVSAGASSVNFHDFKCSGTGFSNRSELDLEPQAWRAFYEQALELRERRDDIRVMIEDPVIALLDGQQGESLVRGSVCGKLSLCIKPNGDVTPCGFIPTVIGNLCRDDLDELWQGAPLLTAMRGKQPRGKCGDCSAYEACLGGCSARALALTGDLNNPDPHCWKDEPAITLHRSAATARDARNH